MINPYIFRGYDIRGISGKDLNFDVVKQIAKSYAVFLSARRIRQVVVGYDCRLTGKEYSQAVIEGLTESGIDVVDLGMCLTQMMYFAQYHHKSDGGVMITASHNPSEYNGMKLAFGYSNTLGTEEIQEVRSIAEKGEFIKDAKPGTVTKSDDLKEAYFFDLLKRVNISGKFKVVVDASNGTTGELAPELLESVGIEVIRQNCEIDGNFPNGTPDPTEEHILKRLGERVVKEGADLGLAFDGDGDRLGVVDETGRFIWSDVLVAIFAEDILDYLPGAKIVFNVLCSKVVEEVISRRGVPVMWRTGHTFIKEKVAQEKSVFGGELSGHFFFKDNFYGHDDAFFAALRILEYLSRKKTTMSKVIDSFPHYLSSPEIKLGCPDDKKVELVDKVLVKEFTEKYPDAKHTTIDGIRIDFADGMLVVRYSQNGPYMTIKFEAENKTAYEERKQAIREILKQHKEINWEEGVNVQALA